MAGSVVWIDFGRADDDVLRLHPSRSHDESSCKAECAGLRFRQKLNRVRRLWPHSVLRPLRSLGKWSNTEDAEPVVVIGDAGIGERIIEIEKNDRPALLNLERFGKPSLCMAPVITAAQIGLKGFGIIGARFDNWRFSSPVRLR